MKATLLIKGQLVSTDTVPLTYTGYPIPQFDNYTFFFTSRHVDGYEYDRVGLADYSNRGFFTAAKNLGHGAHQVGLHPERSSAAIRVGFPGSAGAGFLIFLLGLTVA